MEKDNQIPEYNIDADYLEPDEPRTGNVIQINDRRRIDPNTLESTIAIEPQPEITKKVSAVMRGINEQRMEIIEAFVAMHRCQPEDCEQIVQQTPGGVKWSIALKETLTEVHFLKIMKIYGENVYIHVGADPDNIQKIKAALLDLLKEGA